MTPLPVFLAVSSTCQRRAVYEQRLAAFPEAAFGHALDHFHDTHAYHCQGPRQILREVGDSTDFNPGCWLNFEPRNHRAGQHLSDFSDNPKILELEFQQTRHSFQRIG